MNKTQFISVYAMLLGIMFVVTKPIEDGVKCWPVFFVLAIGCTAGAISFFEKDEK